MLDTHGGNEKKQGCQGAYNGKKYYFFTIFLIRGLFYDFFNGNSVQVKKTVDAGCVLSNINDGYSRKAPDIGAIEEG